MQTVGGALGLLTGFLVFFGARYTGAFYGYFGITHGVLQYSIQDQLVQSAQPLFGTAALLLALAALLWVLDRAFRPLRRRPGRVGWWTRATTAAIGLVLGLVGLLAALDIPRVSDAVPPRVAALGMLIGALCVLRAGEGLRGRGGRALLVVTSILAVFWVATVYAGEAGTALARQVDESPALVPLVTVFSGEYLDIPGSSVRATRYGSPEGMQMYRYTGLRLLTYSEGRWFLVTGTYDGYRPSVTVLPDRPGLQVEVANGQQSDPE